MARTKTCISFAVCTSDEFISLSHEAQALYYQLNLVADGSGALSGVRAAIRGIGASEEALEELLELGFLLRLDDGVDRCYLIRDWWCHNNYSKAHYFGGEHTGLIDALCEGRLEHGGPYRIRVRDQSTILKSGSEVQRNTTDSMGLPDETDEMYAPQPKQGNADFDEKSLSAAGITTCPNCHGDACATTDGLGRQLVDCPRCGTFDPMTGEKF